MEQIVMAAGVMLCIVGAILCIIGARTEKRWLRLRDKVLKECEDVAAFNNEAIGRWEAAEALAHSLETEDGQS